jgi:hypothetical protein
VNNRTFEAALTGSLATRSQIVFAANGIITNRFTLCSMAAKASRRLSPNNKRQSENINEALRNIADGISEVPPPEVKPPVAMDDLLL